MAKQSKTASDRAHGIQRRILSGLVVVLVLAVAVALVGINRIPIAEKVIRDQLIELGLESTRFEIAALTPWQAQITDLGIDPIGTLGARSIRADVSWRAWGYPQVARIVIDGLHAHFKYSEGELDLGPLTPLLDSKAETSSESSSGQAELPPIEITNALIEIDGLGGLLVLALPKSTVSTTLSQAVAISIKNADVLHPLGQATLSGSVMRAVDGMLNVAIDIDDAEGAFAEFSVSRVQGALGGVANPSNLATANIFADLNLSNLAGPRGLKGHANVRAVLKEGLGHTSVEFKDEGLGINVAADIDIALNTIAHPITLTAQGTIDSLELLEFVPELVGKASAKIDATMTLGQVLAADVTKFPDLGVSITGTEIMYPSLPGVWKIDAPLKVSSVDGMTVVTATEPIRATGNIFDGQVTGTASGNVVIDPRSYALLHLNEIKAVIDATGVIALPMEITSGKVTLTAEGEGSELAGNIALESNVESRIPKVRAKGHVETAGAFAFNGESLTYRADGCDRLRLDHAQSGRIIVKGPLEICLHANKEGPGLSIGFGTGDERPSIAADLKYKALSRSMTVSSEGLSAVVRTAKIQGAVAAKTKQKGLPAISFDVQGTNASIPNIDLEIEDLGISVNANGGPDPGWNFTYGVKEISQVAISPMSISGAGRWHPAKVSVDGTLRQSKSGLVASIAAKHDLKSDMGQVRIDSLPLDLTGVQGGIHTMTPMLRSFIGGLTGVLQVSAKADWSSSGISPAKVTASLRNAGITPAGSLLPPEFENAVAGLGSLKAEAIVPLGDPTQGQASIALDGGNVRWSKASVTGISGAVALEQLWPAKSPTGQEINIKQITWGLPITDARLRFQLPGDGGIHIERVGVQSAGGRVSVSDVVLGPSGLPDSVEIEIEDLGLADIAQMFNVVGLEAQGRVSGRLPVELQADGAIAIRDGILKAIKAGALEFKPPTRATMAKDNSKMAMVLDILEDLKFDDLSVVVNGDARKDVQIVLRVKGRNPKVQQGRPVDLTINLSGNIGEAIEAELQNFDLQSLVKDAGPEK